MRRSDVAVAAAAVVVVVVVGAGGVPSIIMSAINFPTASPASNAAAKANIRLEDAWPCNPLATVVEVDVEAIGVWPTLVWPLLVPLFVPLFVPLPPPPTPTPTPLPCEDRIEPSRRIIGGIPCPDPAFARGDVADVGPAAASKWLRAKSRSPA